MPANKKPAPKAPAKPAKKSQPKPAAKKQPAKAAKAAPPPKSKSAAKAVKKGAKPLPQKKSPVKKAPAKGTAKTSPPAKKPAAKAAAPAAKKAAAPAAKKTAAPAKKAAAPAKKAAAAPKAAAPAPAKKEAVKKGTPPARSETASVGSGSGPKAVKGAPTSKSGITKGQPSVNGGVKIATVRRTGRIEDEGITIEIPKKPVLPAAFLKRQRQRLMELRDAYMSSAEGVANDQLRNANEGGDASAFGMHQADAGSDAYDRDFALSLLAKEQDAIYEINEALKRIDLGTYGLCEMSGALIPEERLEALPFTRFTVQCQERIEREQMGGRWNRPVRSLFGLDESAEDSDEERDEEESTSTSSNSESLDFSKE